MSAATIVGSINLACFIIGGVLLTLEFGLGGLGVTLLVFAHKSVDVL